MNQQTKPFQSMHEYLELLFQDFNPTKQQILVAKEDYKKIYQQQYQKTYQKEHIQISFRLNKKQYQSLQKFASEENLTVTKYIRLKTLQENNFETYPIKQRILKLIDQIEEDMYENKPLKGYPILEQLEDLKTLL